MQKRRDSTKPWMKTPPVLKSEPPPEPPYEVIEFPAQQQYSNTSVAPTSTLKQGVKAQTERKCDLCGCTSAQFRCNMCAQQTFCTSCDLMYHRHPKRQAHVRQRIVLPLKEGAFEPPLPPKGGPNMAPIPPPRRNKNAGRIRTPNLPQPGSLKKDGSIMGSLKRLVGGINSTPPPSRVIRNDVPPKVSHLPRPTDIDQQPSSRDSGYLDWDTESRHRSDSFSTFNGPTFPSLMQAQSMAQSMAQLNCPSCHMHTGPVPAWNWNRSQMNLNAYPPWQGSGRLARGNPWHGSMMFPPSYQMPLTGELPRRSSLHSQRQYTRRARRFTSDEETESDLSASNDQKSRRVSPPLVRGVSPALSRRSRRTAPSETDEETMSRRNDRRYKRRGVAACRDASPSLSSRRTYRKKYDDDALSMKSVGSRRSVKSVSNKSFLRQNTRSSSSDSDDELTSDKDVDERTRCESIAQSKPPIDRQQPKTNVKPKAEGVSEGSDWECEHCTYLNVKASRVCDMCCKSRQSKLTKRQCDAEGDGEENSLVKCMKKMGVSTTTNTGTDEQKKKGDHDGTFKRTVSTGTSPPPQTISTQTYEVPNNLTKRNRSFSCEDYSDWNPVKRSNSVVSVNTRKQSSAQTPQKSPSPNNFSTLNAELKQQVKHGVEIVKLLKEAEQFQFSVEDLTVALSQCGEASPIKWLLENWNKMLDTVVTLATNYGREQPENTVGTISTSEARAALHLHNGDMWAAATECIRQRQKKYDQLMARGSFSREDVVTVLTANHGNLEAAYVELNKSQLKPFLMKIWGPPQGLDNDSGDVSLLLNSGKPCIPKWDNQETYRTNFEHIRSWLESIDCADTANTGNSYTKKYTTPIHQPPPSRYGYQPTHSFPKEKTQPQFSRFKSCDNLKPTNHLLRSKVFNQSVENLFHQKTSVQGNSAYHEYEDLYPLTFDSDQGNNQNHLINKYLDYKRDNDQSSQYLSDTEDDFMSDLPLDQPKKIPEFENENYYSADDYLGQGVEVSPQFISKEQIHILDPTPNDFTGEEAEKTFDRGTPVIENAADLNSICSNDFLDGLHALYLLAKCRLDNHIIETKGTTSTSVFKTWINIPNLVTPIANGSDGPSEEKVSTPKSEAIHKSERTASSSETSEESSDENHSEAEYQNELSILQEFKSNQTRVESSESEDSYDNNSPVLELSLAHPSPIEIQSTKVTSDNLPSPKDSILIQALNDETTIKSYENTLSTLRPLDFKPRNYIRIIMPEQVLDAIKLKQEAENYITPESSTGEYNNQHQPEGNSSKSNVNKQSQIGSLSSHQMVSGIEDESDNEVAEKVKKGIEVELKVDVTASTREFESIYSFSENTRDINYLEAELSLEDAVHQNVNDLVTKLGKMPDPDNIKGKDGNREEVLLETEMEEPADLTKENDFKTHAQMYLSDGLVSTLDQAELAVQLMELKFDRSQSIDAALECSNVHAAIAYLQQECQLCAEKFSMKQMVSMLECEHQCCRDCAERFFSVQINENSIDDCVCPFCKKPDLRNLNSDAVFNYFSNFDILSKSILKPQTHELFQQKLRDRALMQDPNFKWCSKCSFGFITETVGRSLTCPSCKTISCTKCGKQWQSEHANKTCEQYDQWLRSQNDFNSEMLTYMDDYGITCPQCDTKFILVKGGCMHLTCTRCKHEFCSDCMKQFSMGDNCKLSDYCVKLGLHAHHPRNCLFYLRDKEPQELKQLLIENNIDIKLQSTSSQKCNVQLQKETDDGLVDMECGAKVHEGGLCKCHLKEFYSRLISRHNLETIDILNADDLELLLMRAGIQRPPWGYHTPQDVYFQALHKCLANLIRKNKVDPVVMFDLAEILQEFRRRGKSLPIRPANTFEYEYRRLCIQAVKEELPLE